MANKILVARGTKARIEEIKSTLATNELVYSTDTGELGVKKADGNIEYFKNATALADYVAKTGDESVDGIKTFLTDVYIDGDDTNAYQNGGLFLSKYNGNYSGRIGNAWGDLLIQSLQGNFNMRAQGKVPLRLYGNAVTNTVPFNFNAESIDKMWIGFNADFNEVTYRRRTTAGNHSVVIEKDGGELSFSVDEPAASTFTPSKQLRINKSGRVDFSSEDVYVNNKRIMNAADIDAIMTGKQDKLVAGENISIEDNVISASGGGIDLNMLGYMNYAADIFYRGRRQSLFANAWGYSLTVDPLEISANSSSSSPRGTAQYPNGETEGVIIPQGVTTIGEYAFSNWQTNDQPLVLPNSVTSIGSMAFYIWQANTYPLVIPESVTSIGNYAFAYWRANNRPLVISSSVTSIGNGAFQGWQANTYPLVIPESVTSIGSNAFQYWQSNNKPLVIPNSVTSIGNYVFYAWQSNNQPLVIPNSVTSIGSSAFQGWSSNNQPLVIPNSVTDIEVFAFGGWTSNNQPLVIPDSVTSIGIQAFWGWELVPYVEIQATTPPTLASSTAFSGQNDAPIYVPDESVDDYKTATNWVDLADRIFSINDK